VVNELCFLEWFALLADQQWTWRENQALARRLKAAKLKGSTCVEDIDYRAARRLDKAVIRALAKDSAWVRKHENIFVIGQFTTELPRPSPSIHDHRRFRAAT